jgi:FixJ family two-component response regulator
MNNREKIFVVDDDEAVRNSIAMLVRSAGYQIEVFADAESFLDTCEDNCEGCLILDVSMPGMDGPTLQQELIKRSIHLPILFLTAHGTIPATVRAIKAGAMDFLLKPVDGTKLLQRVQEALSESRRLRQKILEQQEILRKLNELTEREREIMKQVIAGYTCKEIARQLDISHRTVEIHRAHVMEKTGAANLAELARMYWIANPEDMGANARLS